MNQPDIATSVLKKIQQEHIKPHSSWYFWTRNISFWLIFGLAALTGGRAFGVMIRIIDESELDFALRAPGSPLHPLLMIVPLFWLVFFLLLLLLSSYGLHQTKKGYRFSTWQLVGINLAMSLVIGVSSFHLGDAHRFEKAMHLRAPFFSRSEDLSRSIWNETKEGRLSGKVLIIIDEDHLALLDPQEQRWEVDISTAENKRDLKFMPEMRVRMVGTEVRQGQFKAEIIRPWKPRKRLLDFLDEE